MIEGVKRIPNGPERQEWAEKLGDIVTQETGGLNCGYDSTRTYLCWRIAGHPGTQHAEIEYYRGRKDYPHGSVTRIWFEQKEE
jgi:hypothetical protein